MLEYVLKKHTSAFHLRSPVLKPILALTTPNNLTPISNITVPRKSVPHRHGGAGLYSPGKPGGLFLSGIRSVLQGNAEDLVRFLHQCVVPSGILQQLLNRGDKRGTLKFSADAMRLANFTMGAVEPRAIRPAVALPLRAV